MFDATALNWLDPPHNREGFLRVADLTRVVPIARGNGQVAALPRSQRSLDEFRVEIAGRSFDLDMWLDRTFTDALMVIHDGTVVMERYAGMMVEADRHLLMSISKSITSLLCGVLVGKGTIEVTDRVTDHLTELRSTVWEGCTIEHLLDMTAGVEWDYDRDELDIMDVSNYRRTTRSDLPPSTASWIRTIEAHGSHGDEMRYISLVTDVLGWLLERVSGRPLEILISDHLWSHIGAEHDASIIVDADGFRIAEGGISATLRDMGRLGLMCLQDGFINGRQVVPPDWLMRLRIRRDDLIEMYRSSAEYDPDTPEAFYHDNWWISDAEDGRHSAIGIHGQRLAIHHPSRTVVVKLSSQPEMEDPSTLRLDSLGIEAICSSLNSR